MARLGWITFFKKADKSNPDGVFSLTEEDEDDRSYQYDVWCDKNEKLYWYITDSMQYEEPKRNHFSLFKVDGDHVWFRHHSSDYFHVIDNGQEVHLKTQLLKIRVSYDLQKHLLEDL